MPTIMIPIPEEILARLDAKARTAGINQEVIHSRGPFARG